MGNYVLITGASSGVGRAVAVKLSENNNLILNGRNKERLAQTKELCSKNHDSVIWEQDLSDANNLEQIFSNWLKENKLAVKSLVHCAGEMNMLPLRALTIEAFYKTYSLHVFAPAMLVKVLNSHKYNANSLRSVVFISSNISIRGAKAFSIYGSSKSALDGLMRNLAMELAPKVRVNSILPGGMLTPMTKDILEDDKFREMSEQNYPLGIGKPEDIAPMVEFLLSDNASWITGQSIVIDGGRTVNLSDGKRQ